MDARGVSLNHLVAAESERDPPYCSIVLFQACLRETNERHQETE